MCPVTGQLKEKLWNALPVLQDSCHQLCTCKLSVYLLKIRSGNQHWNLAKKYSWWARWILICELLVFCLSDHHQQTDVRGIWDQPDLERLPNMLHDPWCATFGTSINVTDALYMCADQAMHFLQTVLSFSIGFQLPERAVVLSSWQRLQRQFGYLQDYKQSYEVVLCPNWEASYLKVTGARGIKYQQYSAMSVLPLHYMFVLAVPFSHSFEIIANRFAMACSSINLRTLSAY